jgi:hypothetical protein
MIGQYLIAGQLKASLLHLKLFSLFIMNNIKEISFNHLAENFLNIMERVRGDKDD